MKTNNEVAEVMRAYYVERKPIQFKSASYPDDDGWQDFDFDRTPDFDWDLWDYRVKPEKKKKKMKFYMVEWDLCEDVFLNDKGEWELDTCSAYTIEDQEFYISKEVALERSRRLTYDYSHIWDDDEQKIVELNALQMREMDCGYNFPVKEVELQNITIDELPPIEEE